MCVPAFYAYRTKGYVLIARRLALSISLPSYSGGHNTTSQFWNSGLRLPKCLENQDTQSRTACNTAILSLCTATKK